MSQQINLFNPIFLKQKKYFSVVTMLQAMGLIVVGAAIFYAYANHQVRQMSEQMQGMTARYESEQKRFITYTNEFSPQRANQQLNDELSGLEAQFTSQDKLISTLKSGAIGNTKGYSEFMRAFARQAVNGLWLTGFDINGDGAHMSIQGAVTNPQLLPAYIQRMNQEEIMRGKTFSVLQMKQAQGVDEKSPPRAYVEFTMQSTDVVAEVKK